MRCAGGCYVLRFIAQPASFDNRIAFRGRSEWSLPAGLSKRGAGLGPEKELPNVQGNARWTNERYRDVLRTIYSHNASEDTVDPDMIDTNSVLSFSTSMPDPPNAKASADVLDDVRSPAYAQASLPLRTRRKLSAPARRLRDVCTSSYKTLDAPDLEDNFYLNLIDWSCQDQLACVLGGSIYICNLKNMKVNCASNELMSQRLWASSVHWLGDGSELAIGSRGGFLSMIDSRTFQEKRGFASGHLKRIGIMTSQGSLIATGSADSDIILHDQRMFHCVKTINAHRLEICGLKFNPLDPNVLASGGDDCKLFIWDLRNLASSSSSSSSSSDPSDPSILQSNQIFRGRLSTSSLASLDSQSSPTPLSPPFSFGLDELKPSDGLSAPLLQLNEHRAAVRGLAWSPHVKGLLASGGGKSDPVIRFWDTKTGRKVDQVRCQAQVTNLMWSRTSDELMSTHGYGDSVAPGAIAVWHCPTRLPIVSFRGHADRVLYAAACPSGGSVVTGSSDQTLRFWNIFPEKRVFRTRSFNDLEGKLR
ncbi:WD40-repeat-containing domain protein [Cantharellus anzutake]|uniref:WD40-repeat-containing domain protein n=1 Tax=Cantharellus anzutake TaxID=1750568 RepID=UPI0019069FCE|nr:WD40-repeat-containing domain protein [Cantharellus anzutake]KAF8343119.1 WD40-repeat-containing domain protein [Cantharellus anzutake]